jgi:hypothetical protein
LMVFLRRTADSSHEKKGFIKRNVHSSKERVTIGKLLEEFWVCQKNRALKKKVF